MIRDFELTLRVRSSIKKECVKLKGFKRKKWQVVFYVTVNGITKPYISFRVKNEKHADYVIEKTKKGEFYDTGLAERPDKQQKSGR